MESTTEPREPAAEGHARLVSLGVALALFAWLVARFDFLIDDAFISFRYARNLVEGQGLVYNPGERIEGYSNFLWVLVEAALLAGGLPILMGTKVLGLCSGVAAVLLTYALGRRLFEDRPGVALLAAGLLLHSGWDGKAHFLDPMCGSGTLLIEAAMIACRIPPNINRKAFGFQKWLNYDKELFNTIYSASMKKVREFNL